MTRNLLDRNLRLGDATWQAMTQYIANGNADISGLVFDLYGDPTLSYWGNPGGESTQAAWPMLRASARGAGYVALNGPGAPTQLWSYAANAPGTATLPPSPIVSNDDAVVVAHGNFVDVLRAGVLAQRPNLDAATFGTPALAADGTIYAVDKTGRLYAFARTETSICRSRSCTITTSYNRRWALDLGNPPVTSPVIGADGFIALARVGGPSRGIPRTYVVLARPDGVKFREESVDGLTIGALAAGSDRVLYATTAAGRLARIDFFCPSGTCRSDEAGPAYSTPPLLAYGSLYAGRVDGTVVRKNTTSLAQQASFVADGPITAGPIAGPGEQVLVGTENGRLYSLSANLTLRWQHNIGAPIHGIPAFANDALYSVSDGELRAYNPHSGDVLWTRGLGSETGSGSVAVGYGREVYVQGQSGAVVAFGEGWTSRPTRIRATPVEEPVGPPSRGRVQVSWPPSRGPTPPSLSAHTSQAAGAGYLLQRRTLDGAWQDLAVLPPDTTIYTDTEALKGASYNYRVQTLDPAGHDSEFTVTPNAVRALPAPPPAPTLDSVMVSGADSLALVWHAPAGAEVRGYRVERATNAGGPFAPIATTTGETGAFDDSGLLPGAAYFYRVVALNVAGASGPSNTRSATTRQRSLSAPQNVAATLLADGRVRISWSGGPAGATALVEVNPLGLTGYRKFGCCPSRRYRERDTGPPGGEPRSCTDRFNGPSLRAAE
jgi:hypothetical protein